MSTEQNTNTMDAEITCPTLQGRGVVYRRGELVDSTAWPNREVLLKNGQIRLLGRGSPGEEVARAEERMLRKAETEAAEASELAAKKKILEANLPAVAARHRAAREALARILSDRILADAADDGVREAQRMVDALEARIVVVDGGHGRPETVRGPQGPELSAAQARLAEVKAAARGLEVARREHRDAQSAAKEVAARLKGEVRVH